MLVMKSFANIPAEVQRRVDAGERVILISSSLNHEQRAVVELADMFFVASRHPERGADASHRGGRPGVVGVAADGTSMTFPDYAGNNLFQTLGNLTVDPAIGLLVVDWSTG